MASERDPAHRPPPANDRPDPDDPEAHLYTSEPLEDDEGNEYFIQQQAVGKDRVIGGGEFPPTDTPPQSPAPGSAREGTER